MERPNPRFKNTAGREVNFYYPWHSIAKPTDIFYGRLPTHLVAVPNTMPRRCRCLHVLLVSAMGSAILTVVLVCVSGKCKRSTSSNVDRSSPATLEPILRNSTTILKYLNEITLQGEVVTPGADTPLERATQWLTSDDTWALYADTYEVTVRQRYALASVWFQADEPWGDADGWLSSDLSECDWEGVECNDPSKPMEITKLSLCCINLNGNLPEDLGLLTSLTSFDVGRNKLSGSIPTEYSAAWSKLKEFFVGDNDFTGMVPSLSQWNELEIFDIHANQFTTGIENSVWPTTLRTVYLYNNTLTGDLSPLCDQSNDMTGLSRVVADCDELSCECCTDCCPNVTAHSC